MTESEALKQEIETKGQAQQVLKALGYDLDESAVWVRYARRAQALARDQHRRKAGKPAQVYVPVCVEALPQKLQTIAKGLAAARDALRPQAEKKAKPAPAKSAPAKSAPAKPAPAKPAPAKPAPAKPVVVKAQGKVSTGLASAVKASGKLPDVAF